MMSPVKLRAESGASSFAEWRTISNAASAVPVAGTVTVNAESKSYGTSTPGTLCPSARRYCTRYRLTVTWFNRLGDAGDATSPGSRSRRLKFTTAMSLITVGHGDVAVHGAGVLRNVITSASTVFWSCHSTLLTTSRTGERLSRTNSLPQPASVTDIATAPRPATNF